MMEIIFPHLSGLCTMVSPRWCWTSCTWTPRTAARSTRHSPVGLSQRRRSGSSVRNGSVRTECSKILGPDTSSCSTCLHATVTRVSSATSSWSPWGRGRFTWVQPASTSNCVTRRCPGASTQTPVWHSGYTPVTRQTRGQPTSHCSNSSPASWESSRCARSSRAPCTSHRARWRGWRPQDTTGWSRSVKAGAITGIGSNTFGSLFSILLQSVLLKPRQPLRAGDVRQTFLSPSNHSLRHSSQLQQGGGQRHSQLLPGQRHRPPPRTLQLPSRRGEISRPRDDCRRFWGSDSHQQEEEIFQLWQRQSVRRILGGGNCHVLSPH